MQPLDCSVYGPFKTYYNQAYSVFIVNHPGQPISINNVAEMVNLTRWHSHPKNIISGINVTGMWSFNPNNLTDEDLLFSHVTDRPMNVSALAPSVNTADRDMPGTSSTAANISGKREIIHGGKHIE
ncbi:tigger transposable element-derived protein [Elysia marginata]|uniref:Tigger transposable element-derived protein n=1 Tax=Elysia marginata TaxID=1093978 RepID=A0AAV4F739_9GAST|nr:tigger transposable element-derived protein [Elysia marginata]